METAEDDIRYIIVRDHYESVLSLLPEMFYGYIILIFPVLFNGVTNIVLLNNRRPMYTVSHAIVAEENKNPMMYFLRMEKKTESFLQTLLEYYISDELVIECLFEENRLIEKLLKKLLREESKEGGVKVKQLYFKILLQHLLEILDRSAAFENRDILLVKEFYKMMNSDHIPKRQVKYYADKLCVSRRYLTWAVHKISGNTPKSFIDSNLIEKAKLLLHTKDSIYMIAEELHFESHASFATFFKKHTGLSPSVYRMNLNQKK